MTPSTPAPGKRSAARKPTRREVELARRTTRNRVNLGAALALTLAANVLASLIEKGDDGNIHAASGLPAVVAVILGLVIPLGLFRAHEVLTDLPDRWSHLGSKISTVATLGLAGIAAYISFFHWVEVASIAGFDEVMAPMVPVFVDGFVLVSAYGLHNLTAKPAKRKTPATKPVRAPKPAPQATVVELPGLSMATGS